MRLTQILRLLVVMAGLGLALSSQGLVSAAANISHSYHADGGINAGSIVSLDPNQDNFVQLSNTSNGSRLVGVAVNSSQSLLAVDATGGTVQVATNGTASVLVSTVNGGINVGDQVAISPFSGIGMKAIPGAYVVGLAQTGFNSQSPGATKQQVTDKTGKSTEISVGYVNINIAVGVDGNNANQQNLNALQRIAKSLTGRTIPTIRLVLSLAVTAIALVVLITLIYASIRGSIISVGRNPLAKFAILRTLAIVFSMALLTALVAGTTIFFLLR